MEQQLRALRQHVLAAPSSSSPAAMAGDLEYVARVYDEHAESLAQSAARAGQVEDELEASVALLDACAAARDALGGMRARAVAAETAARRGDSAAAASAARVRAPGEEGVRGRQEAAPPRRLEAVREAGRRPRAAGGAAAHRRRSGARRGGDVSACARGRRRGASVVGGEHLVRARRHGVPEERPGGVRGRRRYRR